MGLSIAPIAACLVMILSDKSQFGFWTSVGIGCAYYIDVHNLSNYILLRSHSIAECNKEIRACSVACLWEIE